MVKDDATKKSCVCTQRLTDMLRAAQPVKKSSLMKVTCVHCGKVFRTDSEREYCFDCEEKMRRQR